MKKTTSRLEDYFGRQIDLLTSDPLVLKVEINRSRFGLDKGFFQINVQLIRGARLAIFEFYSISKGLETYRYQLMDNNNANIARWDSAPHPGSAGPGCRC